MSDLIIVKDKGFTAVNLMIIKTISCKIKKELTSVALFIT